MRTLGFKIIRFRQGPQTLLCVNDGEWERKVVDIGDTLKIFSSEDKDKFAMFMSFSEKGTYLTLAKFIPGRPGEYLAAWVYVPNNLEIEGETLVFLTEQIKQSLLSNKIEGLKELFLKEYHPTIGASFIPSSNERKYAFRNTTFFALKNIIGPNRYQSYYSPYNAIILYGDDSMQIEIQSIDDLSKQPLMESLIFCPPVKRDIPYDVTVHFNQPGLPLFNQPVRVGKGDTVEVVFVRKGFDNITYSTSVHENEQICGIPQKRIWYVTVKSAWFKVIAAHDGNIDLTDRANIRINDTALHYNSSIKLTELEAQRAFLSVSLKGYETKQDYVNFVTHKDYIICLHRAERELSWDIELKNGHTGIMTIKSKYLPSSRHESPLRGYSIGERNNLEYTQTDKWKQRLLGFVTAVIIWLIILLIGWWNSIEFKFDSDFPFIHYEYIEEIKNNQTSTCVPDENSIQQSQEHQQENPYNFDAAIAYLDNNEVWKRVDMANYEDLDELFDFINSYNFDEILSKKEKLKASNNFIMLVQAIESNKAQSFSPPYTPETDLTITISKYIEHLNTKNSPEKESQGSGVASDAAKKAGSKNNSGDRKEPKNPSSQSTNNQNKRGGV